MTIKSSDGCGEGRAVSGRRRVLASGLVASGLVALPVWAAGGSATQAIEVWKSPTCGCCKDWIAHLEQAGFSARVHDDGNTSARRRLGIPMKFGSCHTAAIDGYAIEGHVPAGDIRRLLDTRPDAIGLAVPGMPVGSPGMDGPAYGNRRDPYDVLLILRDRSSQVFQSHV